MLTGPQAPHLMTVAAQHLWPQPYNAPTWLLASALAPLLPLPTMKPGLSSSHVS